jgi:hypothetical protein
MIKPQNILFILSIWGIIANHNMIADVPQSAEHIQADTALRSKKGATTDLWSIRTTLGLGVAVMVVLGVRMTYPRFNG